MLRLFAGGASGFQVLEKTCQTEGIVPEFAGHLECQKSNLERAISKRKARLLVEMKKPLLINVSGWMDRSKKRSSSQASFGSVDILPNLVEITVLDLLEISKQTNPFSLELKTIK